MSWEALESGQTSLSAHFLTGQCEVVLKMVLKMEGSRWQGVGEGTGPPEASSLQAVALLPAAAKGHFPSKASSQGQG